MRLKRLKIVFNGRVVGREHDIFLISYHGSEIHHHLQQKMDKKKGKINRIFVWQRLLFNKSFPIFDARFNADRNTPTVNCSLCVWDAGLSLTFVCEVFLVK